MDNSDSVVSDVLGNFVSLGSGAVGIGSQIGGNFSVLCEGPCGKRSAEVSLEPRTACKKQRCEGV